MLNLYPKRLLSNPRLLQKCYSTSIEAVQKGGSEDYQDKELKRYDRLTNIVRKTRARKPQREPFVKNFLAGIFDKEILTFPELDLGEYRNLEKDTKELSKVLQQRHMVNVNNIADKTFRQNLSDYRAIGLQASQFLDGRECCPLELVAFLDILSEHKLRDSILHNEMLGVQALNLFGNDNLKKKYLHAAMKGESLTAFALNETDSIDLSKMTTTADLSKDTKEYILNGKKCFVVNGHSADVLIVFATTDRVTLDNDVAQKFSAFVVDKQSPGISWQKIEQSGTEIADITFENARIPAENLLGQLHGGESVLRPLLTGMRLSSGPACNAISKGLILNLYKHFIALNTPDYDYVATDAVRSVLGEMLMEFYAAESVTYLTAGMQDWFENQDVDIESAIVKIFCSNAALRISQTCMDMVGLPATLKDHWTRKGHDDLLNYLTLYDTNENLKLYIALAGLQHAGEMTANRVKKIRNPLYHANFMWKRLFTDRRQFADNPKLDLELYDNLHPSCKKSADHLEYSVKRLQYATEMFLVKHGIECVNKHVNLRNIANIMTDCYAMTAVLARASRAHCIGIQFSDFEMNLALAFCEKAVERVRSNVNNILMDDFEVNSRLYIATGKRMSESKGHFLASPLMRFF